MNTDMKRRLNHDSALWTEAGDWLRHWFDRLTFEANHQILDRDTAALCQREIARMKLAAWHGERR